MWVTGVLPVFAGVGFDAASWAPREPVGREGTDHQGIA
ncbi:hypothetical protein BQ8420_28230 [Nocardiopsis sp. JB363]|nr:hypothetical protein BQ8420_28230 [Nocardiopsis sp. JB363]